MIDGKNRVKSDDIQLQKDVKVPVESPNIHLSDNGSD